MILKRLVTSLLVTEKVEINTCQVFYPRLPGTYGLAVFTYIFYMNNMSR